MNKGIIMEVKKNYAIALNDKGMMEKIISKQNMEVGQKIFYFEDNIVKTATKKAYRHNNFIKRFGSIAVLFLLVFTFFQTIKYEDAYAVVSLDINPSIQIEADSEQTIIKVEGVNTDGKNIDFSDIKDVSLDDGIQEIKEKLIEKNYLDVNKEVLVGFAFIKNQDNSTYEKTLKDAIQSSFKAEKVTYVQGDKESVDEAKTKGISLGRYEASLIADEDTKSKIDKAPVKDITSNIKDKENVIQWEATDEKNNINTPPITNTNPNVTTQAPVAGSPIINAPSEDVKPNTNTDTSKDQDKDTKPKKNDVLELEPEVPTQSDKNEIQNKPTDKNNTTSSKTQEDANEILLKPDESLINK